MVFLYLSMQEDDLLGLASSTEQSTKGNSSTRTMRFSYLIRQNSQNHRMVGFRRDLWGSSSPTPLPKKGHLEHFAQELVQEGLEYLQRRLHNLSGQPIPGLCQPQREVLPHVQMELPMLQFVPVAPCPVAGHHWKVWPHPPDTHPEDIYRHL